MFYDLIIIGGGPAACAAAVYAARKQLKTVLVASEFGGQSAVSETIYNWIGTPEISGSDLAKSMADHVRAYTTDKGTLTMMEGKKVVAVAKTGAGFTTTLDSGESIESKTVLIASGSRHRTLDVPGAKEFDNKGVMYCATCDGPLFSGQAVAVAGGGNAAFEAALQLTEYCPTVTLIHRSENFRADPITIEKVKAHPNITIIANATIMSIQGDQFLSGLTYDKDGTAHTLSVGALFVEIGQLPNTEFVKDLVERNEVGKVTVDPRTQMTTVPGIWAAGDCTDGLYHQNNIAAGDAVKAIEDLYLWIKKN